MTWPVVCFLVFFIPFCSVVALKLFSYYFVYISALRIGLRDKGYSGENKDSAEVHEFCETRVRIGIDSQGIAHQYCWKCEHIFSDDPDPKEKEPAPVKGQKNTNIYAFKKTVSNG